jgi:hypothetical protein
MRLQHFLAISAVIGAIVPPISVMLWGVLDFGDLWAAGHRYLAESWNISGRGAFIVDLTLGALLNVPLYMALGVALWWFLKPKDPRKQSSASDAYPA